MPPSPIPAPLPPWARVLLQVAPFISAGLQEVLQYIHTLQSVDQAPASEWRHVQIVWELVGNIEPADRYVTGLDVINITNGQVDNSWTDSDYSTLGAQINAIVIAMQALQNSNVRCKEFRYYRRQFNPLSITKPYPPGGPPERIVQLGSVGTSPGTASQVPQVAMTHTEKTPYPRHWGRSYWPMPAPAHITPTGHIETASVDSLAAAMNTAYHNLQTAELFPVVPVIQIQGAPARALLGVTQIQVDDVPDVVRRRRPSQTTYRKALP